MNYRFNTFSKSSHRFLKPKNLSDKGNLVTYIHTNKQTKVLVGVCFTGVMGLHIWYIYQPKIIFKEIKYGLSISSVP